MKSILRLKTLAVIFCLTLSSSATLAQMNPMGGVLGASGIDPATGLPAAAAMPDWKDPNWKDPDIILTNVFYDNLPLSEIAGNLRGQFKEQFDVLLPASSSGNAINRINGLLVSDMDW